MLTDADKYRVIFALGFNGEVITVGSTNFNSIIRDRLAIDNAFIEDQVLILLDAIEAVKVQFTKSPTNSNLKRIGDIELDTDKSHLLIGKEFTRLLTELALLLGLPMRAGSKNSVCVML